MSGLPRPTTIVGFGFSNANFQVPFLPQGTQRVKKFTDYRKNSVEMEIKKPESLFSSFRLSEGDEGKALQ
jgi:hypothetical protein